MAEKTDKRPMGRPRSGPGGQAVSEYPQMTVRLPPYTKNLLLAFSRLAGTPAWTVVDSAILDFIENLNDKDLRGDVERFARRMTAERGDKAREKR